MTSIAAGRRPNLSLFEHVPFRKLIKPIKNVNFARQGEKKLPFAAEGRRKFWVFYENSCRGDPRMERGVGGGPEVGF